MSANKIFNSFIVITSGQSLAFGLSFVRNLILARLLSRADFGLAATFSLAVTMLELTGRIGLGQQVVQSAEGDSESFLATAHSFQLIAGAISAGALLILSIPMAELFKAPDKAWAFALLALVPLSRGISHLDFQQRQRQFDFIPSVWVDLLPQAIVTGLAYPLAMWIGDFRVVLILIFGKEILSNLMTHALARRPIHWGWDKKIAFRMWNFSWPLILNGLLIFASQQGDQMLVGGGYSLETLALYSACASLIAVPFMIMAQASSSLMLPVLSRVQGDAIQFNREYQACVQLSAVGAVATMVPLILGGEQVLRILYGPKYIGGGAILAWLSVACAFRFLRIAPAIAAMAKADTQNQMISNMFRASSLAFGSVVLLLGKSVEALAASMMFGELLAFLAATYRLSRRQKIPVNDTLKSAFYLVTAITIAGAGVLFGSQKWDVIFVVAVLVILFVLALAAARWFFPESMVRVYRLMANAYSRPAAPSLK
jgi:O-antigen/teichoic acid export membrane protein